MADKGTAKYIPEDDKLRLAVMNCHYIKYPLSYFLDSVVHFGFRNIELFGAMPHFFMDDVDDALVDRVRKECVLRGLNVVSLCPAQGAYPMNIAIDEPQIRRRTIAILKKALMVAEKLGCETMLVSPGFGYHNQDKKISWGHSRDSLTELAETAQQHNVVMMMEPLTPTTANLINTSKEAAQMIREVNSPYVKSMMDIGVMNYMGETVDDYFQNLGDNLKYIHFTDGPGAHVALGDGQFPMAQYLSDIRRNGYEGTLSFEINDKRYLLDPDDALRKNVIWLKEHGLSK